MRKSEYSEQVGWSLFYAISCLVTFVITTFSLWENKPGVITYMSIVFMWVLIFFLVRSFVQFGRRLEAKDQYILYLRRTFATNLSLEERKKFFSWSHSGSQVGIIFWKINRSLTDDLVRGMGVRGML